MNGPVFSFINSILIGLGATVTLDLWSLFLNYAFRTTPSNFCLLGRWVQTMPEGIFVHSDIRSAPRKNAECIVGWITHYMIGILFATVFIAYVGNGWIQRPTLIPAIAFGVFTVAAPFFIMQPAFGYGIASSKASNPADARLRSLINHFVFGLGIYIFGLLLHQLL